MSPNNWSQIASVLGAVLSLPKREWSRALQARLGSRVSLLAEAKRLLDGDADAEVVFSKEAEAEPRLAYGIVLRGRYRIERFVGDLSALAE